MKLRYYLEEKEVSFSEWKIWYENHLKEKIINRLKKGAKK